MQGKSLNHPREKLPDRRALPPLFRLFPISGCLAFELGFAAIVVVWCENESPLLLAENSEARPMKQFVPFAKQRKAHRGLLKPLFEGVNLSHFPARVVPQISDA
jgi:hypothetical protein